MNSGITQNVNTSDILGYILRDKYGNIKCSGEQREVKISFDVSSDFYDIQKIVLY